MITREKLHSSSANACRFAFSNSSRMFHQTFHSKEEERPFSIHALIGWSRPGRHHAPLPNNGQEKATLTKSTEVCVNFSKETKGFFYFEENEATGRSPLQQPCHRRPKRKSRRKLDIFLLVMWLCYCFCCCCFSACGSLADHSTNGRLFHLENAIYKMHHCRF